VKKIAQNVAQPVFVKIHPQLLPCKKWLIILGHLGNLKKLPKDSNSPISKKSPNLVTLVAGQTMEGKNPFGLSCVHIFFAYSHIV
jgi:hypothetical protein